MRILVFASFVLTVTAMSGCDLSGEAGEGTRTRKEISTVQSGASDALVHPSPSVLAEFSNDSLVVRNLKQLILTGDLSRYSESCVEMYTGITNIVLYCTTNTDNFLANMPERLTHLEILETDMTDAGLDQVVNCRSLTCLAIVSWGDVLSPAAVDGLASLQTLKQLSLEISSREFDLAALRASLPGCEINEEAYKAN